MYRITCYKFGIQLHKIVKKLGKGTYVATLKWSYIWPWMKPKLKGDE
jgi:hypothetical protein